MQLWFEQIVLPYINKLIQSPKKYLIGFLLTSVVFGYLLVMAYKGIQQLLKTEIHFDLVFLAISLACQFMGVLLAAGVWDNILRRLDVASGYLFDLQTFCLSTIARKLPGFIWSAVSRVAMYKYESWPAYLVILAVVVESIMLAFGGLVALVIGIFAGAINLPVIINHVLVILVITILILGVGWLGPLAIRFAVKRINKSAKDGEDAQLMKVGFWDILRWLIGETMVIVLGAGVAFFLIKATDANTRVPFAAIVGAWGLAVALGPLTDWLFADLGLKFGIMYLALSPFLGGPMAAVLTLAWRLWVSLLEILFGLVAGITISKKKGWFQQLLRKGKKIHD